MGPAPFSMRLRPPISPPEDVGLKLNWPGDEGGEPVAVGVEGIVLQRTNTVHVLETLP